MIRGTHRAAVLASVVAVGCCCWTSWAAAQVATLDWSAPRGCPDRAYVAQHLAANHPETERHDLQVRARIQRMGRTRYVLRLSLRGSDAQAERRLEATSCASVTDAAIWLIAVALSPSMRAPSQVVLPADAAPVPPIDTNGERLAAPAVAAGSGSPARPDAQPATPPGLARAEAASEPASRATETAESTTPPAAASGSTTSGVPLADPSFARAPEGVLRPRRAPWRVDWASLPRWWRGGVFGGLWSAGLPAPQLSVGARLGFGISALYAELRAAAELARGRRLSDATEARFATQDLGLALCAQWGHRVLGGPCLTAAVLRTTGGSRAVPDAREQVLPWSAAGLAVALGWRVLGGLEIMVETGVQLPLSARPRFTVEGVGEVAVAAPANVYARLGLGFRSTALGREQ